MRERQRRRHSRWERGTVGRGGIEAQPEWCCRLLATSRRLPTRASVERGSTESSYGSVIFSREVARCWKGLFYTRSSTFESVLLSGRA